MSSPNPLTALLANLEEKPSLLQLEQQLEVGEDPKAILEALNEGMNFVGEKYAVGDYYLVELMMAAEIFKEAMEILEPALEMEAEGSREVIGRIVIGTAQGDLHDIGKNIFVALARNAGFHVNDLGIDVPPDDFVEEVRGGKADILGMSCLITMALDGMCETVKLLQENDLRAKVKVIIGGLAVDEQWNKRVGADAYTNDAYEGLQMVKAFMGVE